MDEDVENYMKQKPFSEKDSSSDSHEDADMGKDSSICEKYTKPLSSKNDLKIDIWTHQEDMLCFCFACQEEFRLKYDLEDQHLHIHTTMKPYVCETCQQSFNGKRNFKKHLRIHSAKQYVCETCQMSFSQKGNFKKHLRIHSAKPYVCETCQMSFSQKANFKKHLRIHSAKPYVCETCQMSFSQKANFKKHLRIHTGVCEICQESFDKKSQFKAHMIKHGVKPYTCDVCQKSYSTKSYFKLHLQTHTSEKPEA